MHHHVQISRGVGKGGGSLCFKNLFKQMGSENDLSIPVKYELCISVTFQN